MQLEQLTGPVAFHGEGPVWSDSWGGLRWVDMLAGDVLSFDDAGQVVRRHVGRVAAAVRPRVGGGAVLGVERGFALEDPEGNVTHLDPLWQDEGVRMNEGGCDPAGRFYCGSMAEDRTSGAGSLYRLDPDGTAHTVLTGVTVSNGIEWSPDGTLAYYNDTPTREVSVFDHDVDRGLTNQRTFTPIARGGKPDGLTVDAEGGVWVAVVDRSEVHRYSPTGTLDEVVAVPARKVTACTFGGPTLAELYITTSKEGVDTDVDRHAGSLFRTSPGVTGLPVRSFAG